MYYSESALVKTRDFSLHFLFLILLLHLIDQHIVVQRVEHLVGIKRFKQVFSMCS